MFDTRILRTSLTLALGLSLAACAQQQSPPPAQQTGGMSGTGMAGHSMSGMSGMQGHDMRGMDMQQMMAHCAQMRQQMRQGASMNPDMQQMMAHCDQMDRQMGGMSGAPRGPVSPNR
ncbi:hypothetical protein E2C06_12960 [Dankookia rubra]|uniref:Uncharacterized protein n=1 Tax=Dankookia rubra TaxID=1442381 RepID=A0A4R5QFQ4_9PROT|nr:hypothetical protein [Dankookia rubra]TDH62092.1 hypothetical protein E2C06_12960 [Dankookia rubra]